MDLPTFDEMQRHTSHFLDQFSGTLTFQTFDDTLKKRKHLARIFHGRNENVMNALYDLNDQDAGVFLTVNETNGKGRTAKDIVRVRSVFADLDGVPPDKAKLDHPNMLIESSPGRFHAYWLTDDPNMQLNAFRQNQKAIAHKYNSDPKVIDLPRVMRVPGFFHCKSEPYMSRILTINKCKYTHIDFEYMFPPMPQKACSGTRYQKQDYPTDGEYKGSYGATDGNRNDSLIKIIGGMLKRGLSWNVIEQEAHKHGAACSPSMSESEINLTLKSGRRYSA